MAYRHHRFAARVFPIAALCVLLCASVVLWCGTAGPAVAQRGDPGFEKSALTVHTRAGKVYRFRIEIARTAEQKSLGLMYRRRLAPDAGMLFLHQRDERARMWMKNTYIPLDMLFVDGDGRIVDMKQRTVPHSLAIIASGQPVKAVFEVNAGTAARLGIAIGDRLDYPAFRARK